MAILDEPLLPHDRSFSGHKRERGCRDVLFLLLFIFFWAGMGVCAFFGFKKGQPEILAYGLDYEGSVCHKNQNLRDLTDYSIRFWVNPKQVSETHKVSSLKDSKSLCLAHCPQPVAENKTISWVCNYPDSKNGNPKDRDMKSWNQGYNRGTPYDYFQDLSKEAQHNSMSLKGPCYPVLFKSKNQFWSCQFYDDIDEDSHKIWTDMGGVPFGSDAESLSRLAVTVEKAIDSLLGGPIDILNRYINDIKNGWEVCAPHSRHLLYALASCHWVCAYPWTDSFGTS
ncbi:hypothetical protein CYMTET_29744 [Cymbomonas tetramitiformis]|uniref:Uncharacterized protein n=1 Tax=Cymbomonas tetramitiformis TaxID=36881 RepID=A0AAE0FKN1_9CHLO|nr:hypothetical protein CYMTET_29744 [Cymbomonas tetramitiformis]